MIDSYADGLIDKQEFEPRVTRMRQRLHHLEEQLQSLTADSEAEEELRLILGRLETFATKVKDGLHAADSQTRRDIIRALGSQVEIGDQKARRRPRSVRRDCARSVAHVCPRGWCVRTVLMYFWIVRLHTHMPSESAFTPDPFSPPQSILRRHLPDQGDGLGGENRA